MSGVRTVNEIFQESVDRINMDVEMNKEVNVQLFGNEKRVKFVYNMLKKQCLLPSIEAKVKSSVASTSFRNLGNQHLRENNLYEAMQLYNLALLHAPIGSSTMALALGNRSAVLYFSKKYEESLMDIDTTLGMNLDHPESLLLKLLSRQEQCKKELSRQKGNNVMNDIKKEYWSKFMKVEHPNDMIPCASASVEVRFTHDMGRHVVACKDIKVGEVIAVEKPYAATLKQSHYLVRCYHCLALCNNLMPCDHCCYVMFCSSGCKEAAWTEYHEIECPLMSALVEMDFTTTNALQVLRIVIKARNECSNWEIFIDKVKELQSSLETKNGGENKTIDSKNVIDSKYFQSIHSLETNVNKWTIGDLYKISVAAALLLHLLFTKTKFFDNDNKQVSNGKACWTTGRLLFHHIMLSLTNAYGIGPHLKSEDGTYSETVEMGIATYAFPSLFNHSCASNVGRMHLCTDMALVAIRPIKKGNQLFVNYLGFEFEDLPVEDRRDKLMKYYHFTCTCDACREDWPSAQNVRPAQQLSIEQKNLLSRHFLFEKLNIEHIQQGDVQLAIDHFPQLCKLADAFDNTYPSEETYTFKEGINACMTALGETIPYCYSKLYKWY